MQSLFSLLSTLVILSAFAFGFLGAVANLTPDPWMVFQFVPEALSMKTIGRSNYYPLSGALFGIGIALRFVIRKQAAAAA